MRHAKHVYVGETAFVGRLVDTVILDFESRRRRRIRMTGKQGSEFLLDLPKVATLRDRDILVLEDGDGILVEAKDEPVVDITCLNTAHLVRIAWHLGNRHLPTQLLEDRLRIRQDHVIEEMVQKLGATTARINAPFNPEGGAYGHGETYGHSHG
ncbi:MAG: urease accessory protein UreE [Proteobacteria bacterium]|nr:urease accessory protein UreE [Pseudomonadota bacterium]